jgi:Ca-activated chloride channel homolog
LFLTNKLPLVLNPTEIELLCLNHCFLQMLGHHFSAYFPNDKGQTPFEKLFTLFKELLVYTSGDANEALSWMNELDRQYQLTDNNYGMGDFIEELKRRGYLRDDDNKDGNFNITTKTEQAIRKDSLEQIFGKLKKSASGNHKTPFIGKGDEPSADRRAYQFGDLAEQIAMTDSLRNAQINQGIDDFLLTERDLEITENEHKTQTSTVLMIDISHSMILYGEDRISPAKKVAMALAELIRTKYPKDTLDIIVFGNDAWPIELKDIPYLQVGPYHTNTVAGIELAMDILKRKKNPNKQIFMITDGKPSCIKENGDYYMNSFGLDRKIVNKTLNAAAACRRLKIPITTFMIAKDPYLVQFIEEFTETNQGKAFYTSLKGLGEFIFRDYMSNRSKKLR